MSSQYGARRTTVGTTGDGVSGSDSQCVDVTQSLRQTTVALRQRRAAARRFAPLESGHVDPWAEHQQQTNDAESLIAACRLIWAMGFAPVVAASDGRALRIPMRFWGTR